MATPIVPATLENLKNFCGFTSFLEAYKWLVQIEKLDAEFIQVNIPAPTLVEQVEKATASIENKRLISVKEIKAAAMDELYKLLPTSSAFQRIITLTKYLGHGELNKFLESIPTRL